MPPEPMLDAFIKRHGLRPAQQPVTAAPLDGQLEAHVTASQVPCFHLALRCCYWLLSESSMSELPR